MMRIEAMELDMSEEQKNEMNFCYFVDTKVTFTWQIKTVATYSTQLLLDGCFQQKVSMLNLIAAAQIGL